jgi:hypothetical protein
MKNHRWILHVITPARTAPGRHAAGPLPADPLIWAARGILVLALVMGGLGAEAAAFPGHHEAGHANAHHPAGSTRLAVSTNRFIGAAWMY